MSNLNDISAYLQRYSTLGIIIIPAVYGEKRPEIPWREFQSETPTHERIDKWFNDGRRHNVAAVCGEPSGNFVVLDFDDMTFYDKLNAKEHFEDRTIVVTTGSGKKHVWFRSRKPVSSFKIPQLRIDVKARGSIIIAPPSLHPSGNHYEFSNPGTASILVVEDGEEYAWSLAEKLGIKKPAEQLYLRQVSAKLKEVDSQPPCIETLLQGVEEGVRNEAAIRLASYFVVVKRLSLEDALKTLVGWNQRNKPPLPDSEIKNVVKSAVDHEYQYGCGTLQPWCQPPKCLLAKTQQTNVPRHQEVSKPPVIFS